ncbi:Methylcrotonoyl-CoA carboxylase subunit alpha [Colletotrichum siamense]|uniref:Methylcrotonoyl-CoA carboxylase subunit alpha n=1 Tax=Colletotrichum siamense TaxID=690259 RepID=A0A9P5K1N2_COLSI|nr:Methylcrotonoyl-CoA carboxylase subunit alpha [Colletotrichum siamense]KAF4852935.1 Methylcrotonoyl-CoA carboxylase subunit alpha [Colletotrichum siamense]
MTNINKPPLFEATIPLSADGQSKIRKLLIANRGEIACRIISTCRKLGVQTVAVYTQEDALSQHVADAHESICIGSIEHDTKNPFLNIDLLLKTALEAHADAVHPGYGYLSENADFADRVRATGLTFVGPTGQTISTLGDKRTSKEYLRTHAPEVPLIPGFSGSSQNVEDLQDAATRIGFPVMLKASAGGGGKGMRVVREASQLQSELDRAQSEAQRSFGSSDCILEKFIESSKHVEIQIVGDQHGNVVSLFERDCSVQRRNQKVIEETPCLFLDEQTKKSMSDTAVKIGKLLGYEGAGTVEFVVDTGTKKFYFLEVNTRLQVEHPITEEVVGVDLVSLQLYVAAGGRLADVPELSALTQTGHAIECRLCAEDPNRDFMPSHDTVALWKPANPHRGASSVVRYETAMQSGASISIYFDSMICKIVVWAPTRTLAIDVLAKELANTACVGIKTNQLFLQSCLLHPGFKDTAYQTSFIPTHLHELLRNPYLPELPRYTFAIPGLLFDALKKASRTQGVRRQPFGGVRRGFHNQKFDPFQQGCEIISTRDSKASESATSCEACLRRPCDGPAGDRWRVQLHTISLDDPVEQDPSLSSPAQRLTSKYTILSQAFRSGDAWKGPSFTIEDISLKPAHETGNFSSRASIPPSWAQIKAPMPCKVLCIGKETGEEVKSGESVMVIESMKMEINIRADVGGKFETKWKVGDAVGEGVVLCSVE